jgi:hypothetical protein
VFGKPHTSCRSSSKALFDSTASLRDIGISKRHSAQSNMADVKRRRTGGPSSAQVGSSLARALPEHFSGRSEWWSLGADGKTLQITEWHQRIIDAYDFIAPAEIFAWRQWQVVFAPRQPCRGTLAELSECAPLYAAAGNVGHVAVNPAAIMRFMCGQMTFTSRRLAGASAGMFSQKERLRCRWTAWIMERVFWGYRMKVKVRCFASIPLCFV